MSYWRADFEGADGMHRIVFLEANETGNVLQQFVLLFDPYDPKFESMQLSTMADFTGKPIAHLSPIFEALKRIGPDEYEKGVEMKRLKVLEEHKRGVRRGSPCGKCIGVGRLAFSQITCPDCKGSGFLPDDGDEPSAVCGAPNPNGGHKCDLIPGHGGDEHEGVALLVSGDGRPRREKWRKA